MKRPPGPVGRRWAPMVPLRGAPQNCEGGPQSGGLMSEAAVG